MLDLCNIRKNYGRTVALKEISFEVQSGELFGLLGPNGAGKTTLLSILAGLLAPSSGEAKLLGKTLASHPELQRQIGIVPQDLAIYSDLTARENLHFFGELYTLEKNETQSRAKEILDAIGLTERADHRASTFSGGMKRRLNLGVALMHRPSLLLLDEPTVGVDPQSRNRLFEEVRRLNAQGMTVIYTSHYVEEVQSLCSRVGILDHGELIACDTVPSLLARLQGRIELRVESVSAELMQGLGRVGITATQKSDQQVTLEHDDVKGALLDVATLLKEQNAQLLGMEIEEPSLERVFLHLTGKELRD